MFGQSGSVEVLVRWIVGRSGSNPWAQGELRPPAAALFCPGNQRNCSMQIAEEDIGTLGRSGPFHLGPILGDLIVLSIAKVCKGFGVFSANYNVTVNDIFGR